MPKQTPRAPRRQLPPLVALLVLVMALFVGGCSSSSPSGASICKTIDSQFFYATIPPPTQTQAPQSVANVESLLRSSNVAGLHAEAAPLQRAIDANDQREIISIITHLEFVVCPSLGVPPAT